MKKRNPPTFNGFAEANTTPVPDVLFDELLSELSGAELKVLLYIIRRTFGFKKTSEQISLQQVRMGITTRDGRVLDRGTGLSLSATQSAIKGLIEKGVLLAKRNRSAQRGDEATTYRLRLRERTEQAVVDADHELDHLAALVARSADTASRQGGIPIVGSGGYRLSVTQQTGSQQTDCSVRDSK